MQAGLGCRILAQQIPRPGQRQRGGFVAGQKERHGFIAKLLESHLAAIFVHGGNQQREHIILLMNIALGFSLGNNAIHQRVEYFLFATSAAIVRRRQALWDFENRSEPS